VAQSRGVVGGAARSLLVAGRAPRYREASRTYRAPNDGILVVLPGYVDYFVLTVERAIN
jgi:hypothetical protein